MPQIQAELMEMHVDVWVEAQLTNNFVREVENSKMLVAFYVQNG